MAMTKEKAEALASPEAVKKVIHKLNNQAMRLETFILVTPTSRRRDQLTEANIQLLSLIKTLEDLEPL